MIDLSHRAVLSKAADPVALLVDGENLSSDFAAAVLAIAAEYGVPTVRRVYGKSAQIAGWAERGYRLVPTRPGKNAADLLLSVEAVSLALREQFHTLLIASSDCDYAYLAEHLRELGHEVIGIGEVQSASGYRATFSSFVELVRADVGCAKVVAAALPVVAPPVRPVPKAGAENTALGEKTAPMSALDRRLRLVVKGKEKLSLVALGHAMKGETVRVQTGSASWRSYLGTRKDLYRIEGIAASAVVAWVGP
jgi:hypothetical protein